MTVDEMPDLRRIRVGWKGHFAVVSESDFPSVQFKSWSLQKTRSGELYAVCAGVGPMHRYLMGVTDPELVVDHRDGNGLNNTRANLYVVSRAENAKNKKLDKRNKSGATNVRLNDKTGKYDAFFNSGDGTKRIGSFKTFERAALEVERYELDHRADLRRPRETDKILGKTSRELLEKARRMRRATGHLPKA